VTLLGKETPVPERYAPEILFPIPRAQARCALGLDLATLPFVGEDVWHAWELSWLAPGGYPNNAVARFTLPATTTNLVESKSFKLYLNSLNHTVFESREHLLETLRRDLSAVADGEVQAEILDLDAETLAVTPMPGKCIDGAPLASAASAPRADLIRARPASDEVQVLYSHAMRSLCPVTAQPDWATVIVWLDNAWVEPQSLLEYVFAFRSHQEYHEQCVERMFRDLQQACPGAEVSVLALYTRRGGLDINPWRSTVNRFSPRLRCARQ
jgi:7-cyano-7-deazaguanine reductase